MRVVDALAVLARKAFALRKRCSGPPAQTDKAAFQLAELVLSGENGCGFEDLWDEARIRSGHGIGVKRAEYPGLVAHTPFDCCP